MLLSVSSLIQSTALFYHLATGLQIPLNDLLPPPYIDGLSKRSVSDQSEKNATEAPQMFYLKTLKLKGQDSHDHLFVSAYHVGAGLADATLGSPDPNWAAYRNGSFIQFNFDENKNYFTYLDFANEAYMEWNAVMINAASAPTSGFSFEQTRFDGETVQALKSNASDFAGWWVCDWSRGEPQLFHAQGYNGTQPNRPSSCSEVLVVSSNMESEDNDIDSPTLIDGLSKKGVTAKKPDLFHLKTRISGHGLTQE